MKKKIFGTSMRIRNTMKENKFLLLGFAIVFLLSLFLRTGIFSQKILNDEWHNATVLKHLYIWDNSSAWQFAFNPVVTFQTPSNKFIDNHASHEPGFPAYSDTEGNYYYTSYPQFAYIAPYAFFKILFMHPNVIGLRIFGCIIQFLSALFIYKILLYLTKKKEIAFAGFVTYVFLPLSIYYHSYNFMSDMLVPLLCVACAYFFLKIISIEKPDRLTKLSFVLCLFLAAYTEYIGYALAGTIFLYGLLNYKKPFAGFLVGSSVAAPVAATALSLAQYVPLGNMNLFFEVISERYAGSYQIEKLSPVLEISRIFSEYWHWYWPLIVLICILICAAAYLVSRKRKDITISEMPKILALLLVLGLPVLVHHGLLLHWTSFHAKYFSLLKTAPFLVVLMCLLFWHMRYKAQKQNLKLDVICYALFFLMISGLIWVYQGIAFREVDPTALCDIGTAMNEYATADQVIFIKDSRFAQHAYPVNPVTVMCAKRNIEIYDNEEKARELMRKNNSTSGVLFTVTYFDKIGANVTKVERINLED